LRVQSLGAKLPAGIGCAVWGAGVPADKMQEIAGMTSQLASLGKTPDEKPPRCNSCYEARQRRTRRVDLTGGHASGCGSSAHMRSFTGA